MRLHHFPEFVIGFCIAEINMSDWDFKELMCSKVSRQVNRMIIKCDS